jgi:hypothetical protein
VDYAELSALIRQARENALGKRVHDLGTIQRRTQPVNPKTKTKSGGRFDPFEQAKVIRRPGLLTLVHPYTVSVASHRFIPANPGAQMSPLHS